MKHTQHTALATLTLALLTLTSCTNPNNTNNIPTPETSTTASSGHIPTPDPTTSSETNYSGGSKAPAGEYRPADEHGPAQNVPRPTRPEGMNIESDEGLEKFLGYWNDSVNYATQTGDYTYASGLISEDFDSEIQMLAAANEIYSRGGWIEGGIRTIILGDGLLLKQDNGIYTWAGNLVVEDATIQIGNESQFQDNSRTVGEGVYFETQFLNGEWTILGVHTIPAAES
ncbi:DUF6318 family protein [Rothia nasisuis]|uniref:DUF6318 family protein n=1 Tax=Rothia nasisuis TaxID=2109647 RepID=UPI001F273814|nr:DUF6318 family protein [Rothia nasisuis]